GRMASNGLLVAGATLLLVALLLLSARNRRSTIWMLLLLALAEVIVFARSSLDHFHLREVINPGVKRLLAEYPGDFRILHQQSPPTSALIDDIQDIWGYDPGAFILRYAQLVAFLQNFDPDKVLSFEMRAATNAPLWSMLRCRFVLNSARGSPTIVRREKYLPHV